MDDETHVDGNVLGGLLMEVFGREMTDADGCCARCVSVHPIGAMRVYRGAGDVVRCPTCGNVVIVAATIHNRTRVHLAACAGSRWLATDPGEIRTRRRADRTHVLQPG